VFVGNLSFKTNDRDLAKEFEVAGKVASASIISRGSRSLGYGFVEMESEEEAQKSVQLLNKKVIDGREINVEVARPREEKPAQDPNNAAGGSNGGAAAPSGEGASGGGRGGRGRGRGGRGRFFRSRGPRNQGGSPSGGPSNGDNQAPSQPGAAPAAAGSPSQPGGAAPQRERRPRPPRAPRNDADRAAKTPSNDTLFVANLPFSITDEGLAQIFAGFNIKSAHVVRKHNDRSKGFGFVEFSNADDQQKALSSVDKKSVENRELSVKVALTEVARNGASAAPGSPAAAAPESK